MMAEPTEIDAAIRRYRASGIGPSGESAEKVVAIHQLQSLLAHPTTEAFLVSVLRDREEYDLARVEICKALRAWSSEGLRDAYADALLEVLQSDDDTLVRQWAADALRSFHHVARVVQTLSAKVADATEDPDVRHNALAALRGAAIGGSERSVLERVLSDSDIGVAVQTLLRANTP